MKPCAANRKLIVWQTLNVLDAQQTRQLRAHLETCEGCRRYLAEISRVTECLETVEMNPHIQASESFHRTVAQKLRAAKPDSFGAIWAAYIRSGKWIWRVAVPVGAALALIVLLASLPQPPKAVAHLPATPSVIQASGSGDDQAPTIANYQRIADQSWEKFDALLTRQGQRALPALPSYTASTLSLANQSF